jgi:hypothetical protein
MVEAFDSLARSSGIELGLESSHFFYYMSIFEIKRKESSAACGGSEPKTILQ